MSADNRRAGGNSRRTWPQRAIGLFVLILVIVYGLVFFTPGANTPKLGIDLQGGTRVTLVPQGEEPTQEQLSQARVILENRVNGLGVSGADVVVDGNTLVITVPGEDTAEARSVGQTSQLLFRPVAQPGFPDPAALPEVAEDMATRWVEYGFISLEDAQSTVDALVDYTNQLTGAVAPAGTEEDAEAGEEAADTPEPIDSPTIEAEPLPEPENSLEAAERREETTAMLQADRQSTDPTVQTVASSLMQCGPDSGPDPLAGADDPALPLVACDPSIGQVYVLEPAPLLTGVEDPDGPRLTGSEIDTNRPINGGFNSQTGQMEINFAFSNEGDVNGSQTWANLTAEYLQQQIAITLDSQIISAPVIQSPTPAGSATSITGAFTQEEATELANNLRYGALPLSFVGEDGTPGGTTTTVPASLGHAAIQVALIAGAVGLIAIAIYVFVYFRLFGLISIATLIASGVLVYGSLVLLGRWIGYSLDLSGIAGLIIGVGATADSFVVLYERIKDEVREGKTFRSATQRGWERARNTIVTGNMVTLIGAVIIYFLAVGEVKGFAFTLGLTTVFDLLVTFLITAPLMILASRRPFWSKPSVNGMGAVLEVANRNREEAAARQQANQRELVTVAATTDPTETTADALADTSGDGTPVESLDSEEPDPQDPLKEEDK